MRPPRTLAERMERERMILAAQDSYRLLPVSPQSPKAAELVAQVDDVSAQIIDLHLRELALLAGQPMLNIGPLDAATYNPTANHEDDEEESAE